MKETFWCKTGYPKLNTRGKVTITFHNKMESIITLANKQSKDIQRSGARKNNTKLRINSPVNGRTRLYTDN